MALADQFKISLTPNRNSAQRVRQSLPQVGYGQAEVVASPLRMATVAAAVAADGRLRSPFVEQDGAMESRVESILDPAAARQLGRFMRDAVTGGTGRSLRSHPAVIAGKTGTAEVAGRPSHGWFVGFAPYGSGKHEIAFAIVIEHAGYGGVTAAPAAGEIVSAATAAGLVGAPAAAAKRDER